MRQTEKVRRALAAAGVDRLPVRVVVERDRVVLVDGGRVVCTVKHQRFAEAPAVWTEDGVRRYGNLAAAAEAAVSLAANACEAGLAAHRRRGGDE